jgi:hypothetical protein
MSYLDLQDPMRYAPARVTIERTPRQQRNATNATRGFFLISNVRFTMHQISDQTETNVDPFRNETTTMRAIRMTIESIERCNREIAAVKAQYHAWLVERRLTFAKLTHAKLTDAKDTSSIWAQLPAELIEKLFRMSMVEIVD